MADWLKALNHIRDTVQDDVLVMPSHKTCFYGLHHRIKELLGEHQRNFDSLRQALKQPKRAVDIFGVLFSHAIGPDLLNTATGEAIANLNYLHAR